MDLSGQSHSYQCSRANGGVTSTVVAVLSVLRGLPLLFRSTPKTPLRVACIMAFDMLHQLRTSKRLPPDRVRSLAVLLDFGATVNAAFDGKSYSQDEFRRTRKLLDAAGLNKTVADYWTKLQELELRRPSAFGDRLQCRKVQLYREDVVRLSLGVLTATTFGYANVDEGVHAVRTDVDLQMLYRIVMQLQIIDDVMDFAKDNAKRLPGFLTASESLQESFQLTQHATRSYAITEGAIQTESLLPLRIALFVVSAITRLLVTLGRWRQRIRFVLPVAEHVFGP